LDAGVPWIAIAAMMRPGDKTESYGQLATLLSKISDLRWQLLVAGDGPARAAVAPALEAGAPGRVRLLGMLAMNDVAAMYAAADLCIWPACNEAYGMAMLEAQAAGIPVISYAHRGVPDVVLNGRTGLLASSADAGSLAQLARDLLLDTGRRIAMGRAAQEFIARERSLGTAALRLDGALSRLRGRSVPDRATRAN
jgi:glycosyltransferase involved in cell wall biosynthesis